MEVVDSVEQAGRFMTWLSERHEDNVIAVDTETGELPGNPRTDAFSPWHGRLRLAQVGDTMTGWAIPWEGWNGVFHEAMAKWEGTYACHNISFEHKWFEIQSGFRSPWHRAVDTMIAQQVVNPAESAALKRLTSKYLDPKAAALQSLLDEEMTKNGWTWGTIPIQNEKYLAYGAMDCILTSRLWVDHLKGLVSPYQQIFDMEMAVRRIASTMEINGSRVDVDYCRGQYALLNDHARKVNLWIQDQYGIKNPGSGAQLIKAFSSMGGVWDPESRTPSGAPKIDKYQLKLFSQHPDQRISVLASAVLDMRKSDKLANTYFTNFIEMQEDGLLHPQINTMAARTSRMSIRSPALQTLSKGEKRVRNAFIPREEDQSLITSDLDQVEFRMLAHFAARAGDYALAEMFNRCDKTGMDSFTEILRELYHDPAATKKDKRRKLVKGYVYSCVPLSTRILTQEGGWLAHDRVAVGDRTLGINPQTGKMGWTTITAVHKYDEAEVHTFGDGITDFSCTDTHRWLNGTFTRPEHPDDPEWELTEAWRVELNGKDESRAVVPLNGRLGTGSMKVPQEKIRGLLTDMVKLSSVENVWETALAIKTGARKALLAELNDRYGVRKDGVSIAYSPDMRIIGEITQALAFVTGKVTTTRETAIDENETVIVTTVKSAYPRASSMKLSEKSRTEPVWCVTTEFGTWTMREPGGTAVVTGNSSYGAGVEKMASITGVPVSEMKEVSDSFDRQYPGKKLFTQKTEDEAMRNLRGTGQAYVTNWLGRRLPVDEDKIYTGVNYCLDKNTPILTSDLLHVPAGKIAVGDRLVGFDEFNQPTGYTNGIRNGSTQVSRKFKTATVEAVSTVMKKTYRLTLEDGRQLTSSDDHLWLVRNKARSHLPDGTRPVLRWIATKDLIDSDVLLSVGKPWEPAETRAAGWLAGLYDGEGSMTLKGSGRKINVLTFSQNDGAVMEKFCAEMSSLSLPYAYRPSHDSSNSPSATAHTRAVWDIACVVGTLRPERFINRSEDIYTGMTVGSSLDGLKVVDTEYIGETELVSIQTSTRTLVANGVLSHNCIQSGAADVFKINLLKLDAAGLTDYAVVPVHDEIVLSVPTKDAEDLKREVQKCMTTVEGWTVPLTADSDGPFDRWGDAIED